MRLVYWKSLRYHRCGAGSGGTQRRVRGCGDGIRRGSRARCVEGHGLCGGCSARRPAPAPGAPVGDEQQLLARLALVQQGLRHLGVARHVGGGILRKYASKWVGGWVGGWLGGRAGSKSPRLEDGRCRHVRRRPGRGARPAAATGLAPPGTARAPGPPAAHLDDLRLQLALHVRPAPGAPTEVRVEREPQPVPLLTTHARCRPAASPASASQPAPSPAQRRGPPPAHLEIRS